MKSMQHVALFALFAAGCGGGAGPAEPEEVGHRAHALADEGKRLFTRETFGGNGRTCLTCHGERTGTISPGEVQDRLADDPDDPLFLHDGSDDLQGNGVSRIVADATILVRVPLPPGVTLAGDPAATSVVLRRGVPSTLNTPALDPVLMYDGRAATLPAQALGAVHDHAQNTVEPTAAQLALMAQFQTTKKFFSSTALRKFAEGAPPPPLPAGRTAAERRGRLWFETAPVGPAVSSASPRKGLCAICHAGPMLNTSNGENPLPLPPFPTAPADTRCDHPATTADFVPAGTRFQSVLVSELNAAGNPLHSFVLQTPGGPVALPPMADPGRALVTGNFAAFPVQGADLFNFKIPTLWGVKHTAPYFHDNSAKTLEQLLDHYALFFAIATDCNIDGDPPLVMTAGDKADLLAFLKLL